MSKMKAALVLLTYLMFAQTLVAQKIKTKSYPKKPAATKSAASLINTRSKDDDAQVYSRAINGIVIIFTRCYNGDKQASGFVIDDEHIVTNRHVVECGNFISTTLLISRESFVVESVFFHPDKDLAVLRVPKLNGKEISLQLSQKPVKMQNRVYVLGNPRGVEGFFSKGNVRRINDNNFFFDALLAPGSSGSPVLDSQGKVVGVEATGTTLAGGAVFGGAVSVSEVRKLLRLVENGTVANELKRNPKPSSASGNRGEKQPSYRPMEVPEPSVIELIKSAERRMSYSPQKALVEAQKALSRLPKDLGKREPFASAAHGIIVESYVKLKQSDQAAQHILQAWKDGDFVLIKVKQHQMSEESSDRKSDYREELVSGVIITGGKTFSYKQNESSIGKDTPDQSFSTKNGDIENVIYHSLYKRLDIILKTGNYVNDKSRKTFYFYPQEASLQESGELSATQKTVYSGKCTEILLALIEASNEFSRQEKQANLNR